MLGKSELPSPRDFVLDPNKDEVYASNCVALPLLEWSSEVYACLSRARLPLLDVHVEVAASVCQLHLSAPESVIVC